jgi:hypothetical protein
MMLANGRGQRDMPGLAVLRPRMVNTPLLR